tara:strand:- start:10 stop:543 length:534 start_codon:yes stop_codon:yes gene_type:complete
MIDILEIDNFIKKDILFDEFLSYKCCWYNTLSVSKTNTPAMFFSHSLLERKEHTKENERIRSIYFEPLKKIWLNSCNKNNIKVEEILRMNLNLVNYRKEKYGDIHIDHEYDHVNSIIYLNDSKGDTILFDKNNKIIRRISPKKYKASFFKGSYSHSNGYPEPGKIRLVLVTTFKEEK